MVIVSGIDRAGKSTLALYLRDHAGYSYRHFTNPPVDPYRYLLWQLADSHPRMILDRCGWHDELAYGLTYRNQCRITPHQWRLLELTAMTLGSVVVHLTDSAEGIRSRWGRDEMWPDHGVEALLEHYHAIAKGESWPKSHLPIATFTLPELLQDGQPTPALGEVIQLAHGRERIARLLPPPSLFLGSAEAEFLVVGEAPAPGGPPKDKQGSDPDLPFSRGPASDWLWRAFDEAGLHWWKGAFTDASTFDSSSSLWWWFRSLRQHMTSVRQVICLGERAAKFVHEQQRDGWRVSCTHVWHPGYVKRFRHREYSEWRDTLTVALADWSDSAHLALERGGHPDGSEAKVPVRTSSPAPGIPEHLEPWEKAKDCYACRGRGMIADEELESSAWPVCVVCSGSGHLVRTAS